MATNPSNKLPTWEIPKIKNGTKLTLGCGVRNISLTTDQHLNWFQKQMVKWCFGFKAEDYNEE